MTTINKKKISVFEATEETEGLYTIVKASDGKNYKVLISPKSVVDGKLSAIPDNSIGISEIKSEFKATVQIEGTELDWNAGVNFWKALDASTELTFINLYAGKKITAVITGNKTFILPAYCKKISGTYDGSTTNLIEFYCSKAGESPTVWYTISQEEV